MAESDPAPREHVVVELPTGDWAEVPPGGVVLIYRFDEAGMDEVRAGALPADVVALDSVDARVDVLYASALRKA